MRQSSGVRCGSWPHGSDAGWISGNSAEKLGMDSHALIGRNLEEHAGRRSRALEEFSLWSST